MERETGEELNHNGETRVSLEICFLGVFLSSENKSIVVLN